MPRRIRVRTRGPITQRPALRDTRRAARVEVHNLKYDGPAVVLQDGFAPDVAEATDAREAREAALVVGALREDDAAFAPLFPREHERRTRRRDDVAEDGACGYAEA